MNIQNLVTIPEAMHDKASTAIAAAAGLAPPLRYVDDANGVVIIDFIKQQAIASYPGGPVALAEALGVFARNLQSTTAFPVLGDYRVGIERIFGYLRQSFAPGLLEPFIEGLARVRAAYPWDAARHVSSHNDPNPRNILFDGEKLWLIDWETAYRNDAFIDVAVLAENFGNTPELEAALLKSWSGLAPTAEMRSQLLLARLLTRLYYAGLLALISSAAHAPVQDLTAPTPEEFKALLASGKLSATDSNTLLMLSKMQLANFLTGMASAEAQTALTAFA